MPQVGTHFTHTKREGLPRGGPLTTCTPSRTLPGVPIYFRVREIRVALGLTQAELALQAGVRRATVSRLENARITAIDLAVLEKLADVLGVEPGFLLVRTPTGTATRRPEKRTSRRRRRDARLLTDAG
jgi:DNA-binding Xre family transcriptional regulator